MSGVLSPGSHISASFVDAATFENEVLMEGTLKKRGAKMPVMRDRYCVARWAVDVAAQERFVQLRTYKSKRDYQKNPSKTVSEHGLKCISEWDGQGNFHRYEHAFLMETWENKLFHCVAPSASEKAKWIEMMATTMGAAEVQRLRAETMNSASRRSSKGVRSSALDEGGEEEIDVDDNVRYTEEREESSDEFEDEHSERSTVSNEQWPKDSLFRSSSGGDSVASDVLKSGAATVEPADWGLYGGDEDVTNGAPVSTASRYDLVDGPVVLLDNEILSAAQAKTSLASDAFLFEESGSSRFGAVVVKNASDGEDDETNHFVDEAYKARLEREKSTKKMKRRAQKLESNRDLYAEMAAARLNDMRKTARHAPRMSFSRSQSQRHHQEYYSDSDENEEEDESEDDLFGPRRSVHHKTRSETEPKSEVVNVENDDNGTADADDWSLERQEEAEAIEAAEAARNERRDKREKQRRLAAENHHSVSFDDMNASGIRQDEEEVEYQSEQISPPVVEEVVAADEQIEFEAPPKSSRRKSRSRDKRESESVAMEEERLTLQDLVIETEAPPVEIDNDVDDEEERLRLEKQQRKEERRARRERRRQLEEAAAEEAAAEELARQHREAMRAREEEKEQFEREREKQARRERRQKREQAKLDKSRRRKAKEAKEEEEMKAELERLKELERVKKAEEEKKERKKKRRDKEKYTTPAARIHKKEMEAEAHAAEMSSALVVIEPQPTVAAAPTVAVETSPVPASNPIPAPASTPAPAMEETSAPVSTAPVTVAPVVVPTPTPAPVSAPIPASGVPVIPSSAMNPAVSPPQSPAPAVPQAPLSQPTYMPGYGQPYAIPPTSLPYYPPGAPPGMSYGGYPPQMAYPPPHMHYPAPVYPNAPYGMPAAAPAPYFHPQFGYLQAPSPYMMTPAPGSFPGPEMQPPSSQMMPEAEPVMIGPKLPSPKAYDALARDHASATSTSLPTVAGPPPAPPTSSSSVSSASGLQGLPELPDVVGF